MTKVYVVWEWHGGEPEIAKVFHSNQDAVDAARELDGVEPDYQGVNSNRYIYSGKDFFVEEIEAE
jgi:hypothetical protein